MKAARARKRSPSRGAEKRRAPLSCPLYIRRLPCPILI
ncbi:hypothetical protein BURPSPAST_AC0290 [Burkholderia pseudomallei Pasteur 52237]|uniref:Uncharacterized protein n=1 Tax=Burkholderia pseudomallei 1710a TaxID=320371 RepID=A0A0E1VUD6_BURPE|nr:hypothetical protein BURPSPAST_AC0290 [Burkholderia pseudomallei Pasteur 52237]EET03606.1 hypothetical protein BURPS1710A_A1908 [Burkholderia pseudomallei 1710a]